MGKILELLGGPVAGLVEGIGSIVDNLHTSDAEKLEAKLKLAELERSFQLEVMRLDQQWADTQASVIRAEVQSESWLARNWRPILMLVFTYIVAHNYILTPILGVPSAGIPADMWQLLQIGMGGYIVGRSLEKTAPRVAHVVRESRTREAERVERVTNPRTSRRSDEGEYDVIDGVKVLGRPAE